MKNLLKIDSSIYALPLILILLSIPLCLGMIGPNSLYGVRTEETFSSVDAWYSKNRLAGIVGILSGAVALTVNYHLSKRLKISSSKKSLLCLGIGLGAMLVAVAAGMFG